MFASKNPLFFLLQVLAVLLVALGAVIAAVLLNQPLLALVSLIALGQFPEAPVLPPPGYNQATVADDDADPGYEGSGKKVGFT